MKIQLTPEDLKAGQPIDNGWYKSEIAEAVSQLSKDQQSVNHVATFKLESTKISDATVKVYFNTKALKFNLFKPLVAALSNMTLAEFIDKNPAGVDFEFETVKGQKVQLQIENKLFEGRYVPTVINFVPYNYVVPF